jgi:hypothetical protein
MEEKTEGYSDEDTTREKTTVSLEINDNFNSLVLSRSPKRRVRVQHLRKAECVGDKRVGFDFAGTDKLQEHARGDGVDKTCGNRYAKRA